MEASLFPTVIIAGQNFCRRQAFIITMKYEQTRIKVTSIVSFHCEVLLQTLLNIRKKQFTLRHYGQADFQ